MTQITLEAVITDDGKLEVELPKNLPKGKVTVKIEIPEVQQEISDDDPISEEELEELLRIEPLTGKEIVEMGLTGGWEHLGITDSVAWVEEQRRKRRDELGW